MTAVNNRICRKIIKIEIQHPYTRNGNVLKALMGQVLGMCTWQGTQKYEKVMGPAVYD